MRLDHKITLTFCAILVALCLRNARGEPAKTILTTGLDGALVSQSESLGVIPAGGRSFLQFQFAFGTDETAGPGEIFDSFSLSLRDGNGGKTALLFTADAQGVFWAPPTPGTLSLDGNSIMRVEAAFPDVGATFTHGISYEVTAAIPSEFGGQTVTASYDLFDNQNAINSLGAISSVAVVPEPRITLLLLTGFATWAVSTRRKRC